jgi:type II secretory pathway component GspD/PulD (secretin)
MNPNTTPGISIFRRSSLLGLAILGLTCTIGGSDPAALVASAREARADLEEASLSDLPAVFEEGQAPAATTAEPAAAPADAAAPEESPAAANGSASADAAAGGEEESTYTQFDEISDVAGADVRPATGKEETADTVNGRITLALDDMTLEDTVRLFGETAGANIVAAGTLLQDKRVTANLRNVEWHPALSSILDVHGLALVEKTPGSGVYSIQTPVPNAPEPTIVETFFLQFTTVGEIRDPVKGMLRPGSVMTMFPSRNALVIRSTENNLKEVRALIEELDRPGRQVLIETKIMELSDGAMKELGIRWDSLKEFGVQADINPFSWSQNSVDQRRTESSQDASDRLTRNQMNEYERNRVSEYGRSDLSGYSTAASSQRDQSGYVNNYAWQDGFEPIPTGYIPNSPYIIPPNAGVDRGSEYYSGTLSSGLGTQNTEGQTGTSSSDITSRYDLDRVEATSTRGNSGSVVDSFVRDIVINQSAILNMSSLSFILSALETMDGVSIVSNPKIIVTSGSTNAFFSIGGREPIIETEIIRGTAESPGDKEVARLATDINTEFIRDGYLKTGIDLRVVATVKTDDFIEADIHPSLRRRISEKTVGGNSWPIISVKEIGTTFTLRSGQTVAIGGLTDSQETKITTRVPFLGSIPIIGRLFSHEEDATSQVETIIFVTLSVADPGQLREHSAIPQDARLVHQRMIKDRASREEFEAKLQEQKDAIEAEAAKKLAAAGGAPGAENEETVPAAPTGPVAVIRESGVTIIEAE